MNVAAGTFTAPNGKSFKLRSSCRVTGEARPTSASRIGFELWLPEQWSGRYVQLGNGGFAGNIDEPSLANELRLGNAAAMTDTGHKADQFDASWALNQPEKVIDYGYRSIKVTADSAGLLIGQYYRRRPDHRYFVGCSNGGRQALIAAQRYPGDWDGIIAGSPALDWTEQLATFAAVQHQLRARPENWIPIAKLPAIQRAAAKACPSSSNIICRVDAAKLRCRSTDEPDCLTAAQARSLDLIQSGPRDQLGKPIFHGFAPTGDLRSNWGRWILNADRDLPGDLTFATQAYRYLILDRPDWRIEEFELGRDFKRASERRIAGQTLSTILDARSAAFGRFARRGGKLIIYIGGADAVISPAAALAYYRSVAAQMGGMTHARKFMRLFIAPGMEHCQGGVGPNAFGQAWVAPASMPDKDHDIRLALQSWVEGGLRPDRLVAARYDEAGTLMATQILRPFPHAPSQIHPRFARH